LTTTFLLLALAGCAGDRAPPVQPPNAEQGVPKLTNEANRTFGEGINDRILFAYDSAEIEARYRGDLQKMADFFARYPTSKAIIEGHADERGTREYNLALGRKRAEAMRRALVALGVSANRLGVISYGKERPAAVGSDETAWAQNRRAVAVLQ
jgi:peptidoglycan-associated lipoprotein